MDVHVLGAYLLLRSFNQLYFAHRRCRVARLSPRDGHGRCSSASFFGGGKACSLIGHITEQYNHKYLLLGHNLVRACVCVYSYNDLIHSARPSKLCTLTW